MKQKNRNVHKMVAVAMFAAIGMVLQFFGFPIFPAFSFLKIDFSDIPVMLSMFLFGPMAGITTAFLRSLLHLLATGLELSNMVGDVASFIASVVFTLPMYWFFKDGLNDTKKKIAGVVSGILAMSLLMSIANYFVITPIYLQVAGLTADKMLGMSMMKYVAIGILPFNLVKGIIVSTVFLVLYTKLLPWLSKKHQQYQRTKTN